MPKRIHLAVSNTVYPFLQLPQGYEEVWSVNNDFSGTKHLVIQGPFPEEVQDNDRLEVQLHLINNKIFWQWLSENGETIGNAIEIVEK